MSKLEELIQKYCPDGVEYLSIGSIITRVRNKGGKNPSIKTVYSVSNTLGLVKAEDYRENVIYSEDTSNYIVVEKGMFAYNPARLNIGSLAWLQTDQPGLVSPMYVVFSIDQTKITPEYLYLHLKSQYVNVKINSLTESGARFRFDFERWGLIEIPVPPIPIQEEVVRILDTFSELQVELQKELKKRKQQYNYYKSYLLSRDYPIMRIGDITRVFSASRVHKNEWQKTGVPFFRSSDVMSSHRGEQNPKGEVFISKELYEKLSAKSGKIRVGDLLVTGGGSIGVPYLVKFEPLYVKDADLLCIVKNNILDNRFLYHYMLSEQFQDYLASITHDATIAHYTISQIKETPVPVPSWEEQQMIIAVLDKFNVFSNDTTMGLPAEIEKRRQQYEFYRDKLLTFKRKEA